MHSTLWDRASLLLLLLTLHLYTLCLNSKDLLYGWEKSQKKIQDNATDWLSSCGHQTYDNVNVCKGGLVVSVQMGGDEGSIDGNV